MNVNGDFNTVASANQNMKILITQPRPESEKSPYYELARKYNVELEFRPFILLEAIPAKEFRRQKIDLTRYTAVVFTSRNAIDHFFDIITDYPVQYRCGVFAIMVFQPIGNLAVK